MLIVLDTTSKSLRAVLGAAHTTNPVDFTVTYADSTVTSFTEASAVAQSNGTTNAEILAAPSASTQRVIKSITVWNNDTIDQLVTLYLRVTATDYGFYSETIEAGGFRFLDDLQSTAAAGGGDMVLADIQTVTGAKTFNSGKFILAGSSSGTTTVNATAAASGTLTLPAATDTLVGKATTDTLTNKTLTSPVINTGTVGTSLVATTDGAATLGSGSKQFSQLHLANDGYIAFNNANKKIIYPASGSTLQFDGLSPIPITQGTGSLGLQDYAWANLYLSGTGADTVVIGFNANGTGEIFLKHLRASTKLYLSTGTFEAPTISATTAFVPDANDGAALGTTALQFSDVFLAEGGVINFDNGDVTVTQSGNTLTVAGGSLTAAIAPRVVTTTDDATAVIDLDATDRYHLTAIANATTISTTGTLVSGKARLIRLKDAGVAKGLTWDAAFRAVGVTLPTTTVVSKTHYIVTIDNTDDSKLDVVDVRVQA